MRLQPQAVAAMAAPRRRRYIAGGVVAAFTLTSAVGGSSQAFTIGHAFKQGDVPSGAALGGDTAVQVIVKNAWPDGSAKFAIVSGRRTLTAGVPATVTLSIGGAAASGSNLSTTDLKATGVTASIAYGAFGTASWATTDWDSPFSTWVSGPEMSSWLYRKAIGADAHLVGWLEVRLYAGGAVEALPWIENGYLTVASPTSKSGTATFTLGGSSRYSSSLTLLNHQRAVLATGTTFSHWLGTDPAIVPAHDTAYFMASKLVPNYRGVTSAASSFFTDLPTSYTPLAQASYPTDMGGTGDGPFIAPIPGWEAGYFTSGGDARALTATIINAYCAGRYGIHFRDQSTNRPPLFSSYPNLVLEGSSGVAFTGSSSTSSYTPTAGGTTPPTYDSPHHPAMGYTAYLLTGRYYFLEELQFLATTNFLKQTDTNRQTTKGIFLTAAGANTTRGAAWAMRTLAIAASATPDGDALRTEFVNSVNENVDFNHARHVAQANNPLGVFEPYDHYNEPTSRWEAAIWMEDFFTTSLGWLKDLQVTGSAYTAKLDALLAWKYPSVVDRLGTGAAGTWNYRYAAQYTTYFAPSSSSNWVDGTGPWYADWAAVATAMGIPAADGGTSLQGSSGSDAGVMASGYWGYLQGALAYAVDHGHTGALAAYTRLTSASNYAANAATFNAAPAWGIKPRTV